MSMECYLICGFDLHFSDYWWCWAWFYLLFGLLNIFMDIVFKSFSRCLSWRYDFWIFCLKVLCKSRIARHTECSIFLSSVIAFALSCIVFFKHSFHFDEIQCASSACDVGIISEKLFPNPGFRRFTPVFSALLSLALRLIFNYCICVSSCVHGHAFAHGYLISVPIVWTHLLKLGWFKCESCWTLASVVAVPASQRLDYCTFAVFGGRSEPSSRPAHQRACWFYLTYDTYF